MLGPVQMDVRFDKELSNSFPELLYQFIFLLAVSKNSGCLVLSPAELCVTVMKPEDPRTFELCGAL